MIYFDNAATTKLSDFVKQQMINSMDIFGNPSSLHMLGIDGENIIRSAQKTVSQVLKCKP